MTTELPPRPLFLMMKEKERNPSVREVNQDVNAVTRTELRRDEVYQLSFFINCQFLASRQQQQRNFFLSNRYLEAFSVTLLHYRVNVSSLIRYQDGC